MMLQICIPSDGLPANVGKNGSIGARDSVPLRQSVFHTLLINFKYMVLPVSAKRTNYNLKF